MKKKLLLLPLLAALAFASCSNDDLSTNGGEKPGTGDLRYLAVNIVTPNESAKKSMSRAADGFEAGTDAENAVTSALFILLDETKVAQAPVKVASDALNPWTSGATDANEEKISSAVLVIDGQNTKPENIKGILAVLNPTTEIAGKIAIDMTLDEVKAIIDDCSTTAGASGSFVMSNSAYADNENAEQLAAKVTVDNLKTTPELAKASPVKIYVERAVAKIKTNALTEMTVGEADNQGKVKVDMVDETGTVTSNNLTIDIQGVQIANCAEKSYLFKNIDGFTATAPFTGWNDVAKHRSYWANIPSDVTYKNYTWNEISGAGEGNTAITGEHAFYAQENVVDNNLAVGHTAVIVTAQLKLNDAAIDLVKIADKYYTSNGALKQLAGFLNNLGYRVKTVSTPEGATTPVTKYETLADNSLTWLDNALTGTEVWEGFAQLSTTYAEGKTFVKYNAESTNADKYDESSADAINEVLKGDAFSVLMWKDGHCYYFVDIEHFGKVGEADNQVTLKGIIRNHIYNLNLKTLKGLGVPVFDPKVEIIPQKPTEGEYFYLAAEINILKWVLVNQEVNFN